jgi:altronate dehydratase
MGDTHDFSEIGRIPMQGDNVAIATEVLKEGSLVKYQDGEFNLNSSILEGHRFAVAPIPAGNPLLSWNLPFGVATVAIAPGDYVCNPQILESLKLRNLDFALPLEPNFEDKIEPYDLDEDAFAPGAASPVVVGPDRFMGYTRGGSRGVGTRNTILILGTTSRTASFANRLRERASGLTDSFQNIDGVVCASHTEGGAYHNPNNLELLLRTLAGFVVHPNVGAVLVADYGNEPLTNIMLRKFMEQQGYPYTQIPHEFLSLKGGFQENLDKGYRIIEGWCERVNRDRRTTQPISALKIALQCGGSDAFSGVSGNPLVSWVAREVIRNGGSANLAETDELIGAESYILKNVRDLETAKRFLEKVEAYKTLASWHGTTAEGNPSGGNKFRGLYNIVLKSIGAAMKRHPDVRLDHVIEYAHPMKTPGYYFMDSPGNDLESIAGQVASGCNMIFFVTGNGSITNFPFVPTLKVITTTKRYELLSNEMDVNAGAYLDGASMDELGASMLNQTIDVASGSLSKGEHAGHSQVSIWRDWRQTDTTNLAAIRSQPEPTGSPLPIQGELPFASSRYSALVTDKSVSTDHVGLVLPTSLCSGQVAEMCAKHLAKKKIGFDLGLSNYIALVHTEGCGMAGEMADRMYARTMVGYLTHPMVRFALLLEHGCEKTHNDYLRNELDLVGVSPDEFGWASIQMDGGIENVFHLAESWFREKCSQSASPKTQEVDLSHLSVGMVATGPISEGCATTLAGLTRQIVGEGGTVVLPENCALFDSVHYKNGTSGSAAPSPTLLYGQRPERAGLHIMETQTDHWVESLTGLGGTGVELLVAYAGEHPLQGHPLIPMLLVSGEHSCKAFYGDDLDLEMSGVSEADTEHLYRMVLNLASRKYRTRASMNGNIDFQFTRGLLGVSM